jgi:hypothetical protein
VLPQVPDLRSLATDQGCETALETAIQVIEQLLVMISTQTNEIAAQSEMITSQQDTIAAQSGAITAQQDTIASQQATIASLAHQDRLPSSVKLSVARKESPVPTTITVDTVNEVLIAQFSDDHGNATPAPSAADGSAAVLTATSDTPTAATVGDFAQNGMQYEAPITPVALGSANLGMTVTDSAGNPIALPNPVAGGPQTFNDEVTAQPVDVIAGPANSLSLSVGTP